MKNQMDSFHGEMECKSFHTTIRIQIRKQAFEWMIWLNNEHKQTKDSLGPDIVG